MNAFFSFDYMLKSFPILLSYLDVTLLITIISFPLGMLIGFLAALARIKKIFFLNKLVTVYVSYIRGTPFLVQLFLICFGLPQIMISLGIKDIRSIPGIAFVILMMALHEGGYLTEVIRAGILAVDKGQFEAARSIGLSSFQVYSRIILPQAFRLSIPVLGNTLISAFKNTSLVFNAGVVDMMRQADLMGSYSYHFLELYIDTAIIYIALSLIVQLGTNYLDRRFVYSV